MIQLVFRATRNYRSGRTTMPVILRDPKFTRDRGIATKKNKKYEYDLDQPNLQNAHLYYDSKNDPKIKRQQRNQKKQRFSPYELISDVQEERSPDIMIQELSDRDLLNKPSRRIINNILNIEKFHPEMIKTHEDLIISSIQEVSKNVTKYKYRDFAILMFLSERYAPRDSKLWTQLVLNLTRIIQQREYFEKSLIKQHDRSSQTFIYLLNSVYKASYRIKDLDIQYLQKAIQQYFIYEDDQFDDVNQKCLLTSTICKILPKSKNRSFYEKKMIPQIISKIQELDLTYLCSLVHMIYKNKALYLEDDFNKILMRLLELKDKMEPNLFAILSLSIGNLRTSNVSQDVKQFMVQYLEQNHQKITKIQDIAFIMEGFKKMKIQNKKYYDYFENEIQNNLSSMKPEQSLQILRGCQKNVHYQDTTIQSLINHYDNTVESIREEDKNMVRSVLQKFEVIYNLPDLKHFEEIYQQNKIQL